MADLKQKSFTTGTLKQKSFAVGEFKQKKQSFSVVKTSLVIDESNNLMLDFSKPINSQYLAIFVRKRWR